MVWTSRFSPFVFVFDPFSKKVRRKHNPTRGRRINWTVSLQLYNSHKDSGHPWTKKHRVQYVFRLGVDDTDGTWLCSSSRTLIEVYVSQTGKPLRKRRRSWVKRGVTGTKTRWSSPGQVSFLSPPFILPTFPLSLFFSPLSFSPLNTHQIESGPRENNSLLRKLIKLKPPDCW